MWVWLLVLGGFARRSHRLVEHVRVKPWVVERIAAAPVRQRKFRGHPNVLLGHCIGPTPRGVRDGRACYHQIGPHPVDVESGAQRRDAP